MSFTLSLHKLSLKIRFFDKFNCIFTFDSFPGEMGLFAFSIFHIVLPLSLINIGLPFVLLSLAFPDSIFEESKISYLMFSLYHMHSSLTFSSVLLALFDCFNLTNVSFFLILPINNHKLFTPLVKSVAVLIKNSLFVLIYFFS